MSFPLLPASWTTPRLRLRPFAVRDASDVLAYAVDEAWGRFIPVPTPYRRSDAEQFIAAQLVAEHATAPRWALEFDGAVSGSVELSLKHDAGIATLHYGLARHLWGQGLMTEAVRSVVARVFSELPHIMRVASWADVRNAGSWRVMEKVGLQREGLLRSSRVMHGERVDDVHYAILRTQWAAARSKENPQIRPLVEGDPARIAAGFDAIGWNKPVSQYQRYLAEQARGARVVRVAEVAGEFAGYVTLVWSSLYAPLRAQSIPEIQDLNVLPAFRRQGVGTALMDAAERLAAQRSAVVGIGVGMDPDYGAAQAMYVRRGYVPDARGLSTAGRPVRHGETVTVDHGLVLHFTKRVKG